MPIERGLLKADQNDKECNRSTIEGRGTYVILWFQWGRAKEIAPKLDYLRHYVRAYDVDYHGFVGTKAQGDGVADDDISHRSWIHRNYRPFDTKAYHATNLMS